MSRLFPITILIAACLPACGASSELRVDGRADVEDGVAVDGGPDFAGIQCGFESCDVPAETCIRCGGDWEKALCLSRDDNVGDASMDYCADDPFHWVIAQCDGPEDCPEGLECVGLGAAIGSVHLMCGQGEGVGYYCHTDEDCENGWLCVEDDFPFRHCAP